jgi:tRNA(adenine34) deaminase
VSDFDDSSDAALEPAVRYMRLALEEARRALRFAEVPVGAVIVQDGRVIASAHNQRETLKDPTAHAEMLAITQAAAARNDWRLEECELYVTLEPCPMCAGALVAGRVARVVYGAADAKGGACGSLYNLCVDPRMNHEVDVVPGVLAEECAQLLTAFFAARRR